MPMVTSSVAHMMSAKVYTRLGSRTDLLGKATCPDCTQDTVVGRGVPRAFVIGTLSKLEVP